MYATGCCSAQLSGTGAPGTWLPNRSRAPCATEDTGFHSANVFSGPGRVLAGTNVLATNVSGKITMNDALLTTSGLGASRPTNAITHENA